jgi:hypothetical protein
MGTCAKCQKERKIYVAALCYVCYEDALVRDKLQFETLKVPYPQLLFDLYLTYIRRYDLKYHHLRQARKLKSILETYPPRPFKSWLDVYQYDEKYPLPHKPNSTKGRATLKIGFMLEELGVLPPREEEVGRQVRSALAGFSKQERLWIDLLAETLNHSRRAENTVCKLLINLKLFKRFCKSQKTPDLLAVNQELVEKYLISLHGKNPAYIRTTFCSLNQTYRFLKFKKAIFTNPCAKIKISRIPLKLCVASEKQIHDLIAFVKSENSNPEWAILIVLILFYGLTPIQLTQAQCLYQNSLKIILRRKPITRGRRFYNREQTLSLPQSPPWFLRLQEKFFDQWSILFKKTKKSYPHRPLLLPYHAKHNRPICTHKVRERIKSATCAATGHHIPARILRQTCGHLYSQNGDASILSTIGWSPQFAFTYTWAPRTCFSPKE